MANECVPFWDDADTVTAHAAAAVTGKRFVGISGALHADGNPQVTHAAAVNAQPMRTGVACYDAAAGAKVTLFTGHHVVPVTAAVAITAGDSLYAAADGRATNVAGTGPAIATAWGDAAAGADVPAKLAT